MVCAYPCPVLARADSGSALHSSLMSASKTAASRSLLPSGTSARPAHCKPLPRSTHRAAVGHVCVHLAVPVAVQQRALKAVVALLQEAAHLQADATAGGAGSKPHTAVGGGCSRVRAGHSARRQQAALQRSAATSTSSACKPHHLQQTCPQYDSLKKKSPTWRGSLSKMRPASLKRMRAVSPVFTHRTWMQG